MKEIPNYENYLIDEDGNVFSKYTDKYLKIAKNDNGYLVVRMRKDKKASSKYIHKLVAETFIPNPNNYPYVRHKDGNITNNNVSNLEWTNKGKKVIGTHVITGDKIVFNSMSEAGDYFGTTSTTINNALRGICKTSCGYTWEYA